MPTPYYTTNPSDYTQLEGIYVTEKDPPGFIRGANLSVVGFAGQCVRGPLTPQEINSTTRFVEVYGARDYFDGGTLKGEVWKALLDKPFGALVVRRCAATAAVAASFNQEDTDGGAGAEIIKIEASSVGEWGDQVYFRVVAASNADADAFNLLIRYRGEIITYENLKVKATGEDNLADVVGDDIANFVVVTKLADGRPLNTDSHTGAYLAALDTGAIGGWMALGTTVAAFTSVAGDDGTIAASDYTGGITDLAGYDGVAIVLVPEATPTQNTTNGDIVTAAAASSDRIFLAWSGTHGQTPAQEQTDIATDITTRTDRILWCYNSTKVKDPIAGVNLDQAPHVWMASILTNNDVDIHPGARITKDQTAGIRALSNTSLSRADLIALRDDGISTLERDGDVWLFRSAVTTDLTSGLTEVTRRRMADFLQISSAARLAYFVKRKNTLEVRAQMLGEIVAFCQQLKDQSRVVEDFQILQAEVNTEASRAQGMEKILMRVKLIGHILYLVLGTEIGTGVVIEESL